MTSDYKSGFAPVNGIKMYYEIHGAGDVLVLIHGGGSTISSNYSRIIPLLSQHFRVVAMELQAHGRTSDRDADESFEQDADDVAALLHYLNLPGANVIGFSNGGNTAMQLAVRHPALVNKLVLASAFYKRDGMVQGFFEGLEKATLNDMPMPLQEAFLKVNPDKNALRNMFEKDRKRMVVFKDWNEEILKSIRAKTLVVCGDKDVNTVTHAAEMAALIPQSRMLVMPSGHGAYIGDDVDLDQNSRLPEYITGIITEFLMDYFK